MYQKCSSTIPLPITLLPRRASDEGPYHWNEGLTDRCFVSASHNLEREGWRQMTSNSDYAGSVAPRKTCTTQSYRW
jgi:hypothetical protein